MYLGDDPLGDRGRQVHAGSKDATVPICPSAPPSDGPHEGLKAMLRNSGSVEVIVVGERPSSPMDPKTRRILRKMGMDTSAIG